MIKDNQIRFDKAVVHFRRVKLIIIILEVRTLILLAGRVTTPHISSMTDRLIIDVKMTTNLTRLGRNRWSTPPENVDLRYNLITPKPFILVKHS